MIWPGRDAAMASHVTACQVCPLLFASCVLSSAVCHKALAATPFQPFYTDEAFFDKTKENGFKILLSYFFIMILLLTH